MVNFIAVMAVLLTSLL